MSELSSSEPQGDGDMEERGGLRVYSLWGGSTGGCVSFVSNGVNPGRPFLLVKAVFVPGKPQKKTIACPSFVSYLSQN